MRRKSDGDIAAKFSKVLSETFLNFPVNVPLGLRVQILVLIFICVLASCLQLPRKWCHAPLAQDTAAFVKCNVIIGLRGGKIKLCKRKRQFYLLHSALLFYAKQKQFLCSFKQVDFNTLCTYIYMVI